MTLRNALVLTSLFAACPCAFGQSLLRDVRTGFDESPSGVPQVHSVVSGGRVFFRANDQVVGDECWVSDGTTGGTRLVSDLIPGTDGSQPQLFAAFQNGAVFTARTLAGTGLWFTDGSASGTVQLAPVTLFQSEHPLAIGNQLFFSAWGAGYPKLWISDGTPAGTREVDPTGGPIGTIALTDVAGTLYFISTAAGRVFKSDGTAAGTVEIAPLANYGTSNELAAWNGRLVFSSYTGSGTSTNGELWISDGTAAGTARLRSGFVARVSGIRAFGPRFLFIADDGVVGTEMWVSDGTSAGTRLLLDIAPNPDPTYTLSPAVVAGSRAFFRERDATHGVELWATDGTSAGTYLVLDIWTGVWDSYPRYITAVGPRVFFRGKHWNWGEEPWVSDGTAAGTRLVANLHPLGDSLHVPLGVLGNRLLFSASDGVRGFEAWISDGTATGTSVVREIGATALDSDPSDFAAFGVRAIFAADDGTDGREPWLTDGTSAGTQLLADVMPGPGSSAPGPFVEWRGRTWFAATDASEGREPWVSDGTAAGTTRLVSLVAGAQGSDPADFTALDDSIIFAAMGPRGRELWSSDGTASGTAMIDLDPSTPALPESFVRMGDRVYFTAFDGAHGRELWSTDGTIAGTQIVVDLRSGTAGARIHGLMLSAGRLWFSGSIAHPTLDDDLEPWVSDGTASGTFRLADIAPGIASSSPAPFVEFSGRTWFTAAASVQGRDLWVSDGTVAGTLPFLATAQSGHELAVGGDRLFFVHQGEPWSTDGTLAGSAIARDIVVGPASSSPRGLVGLGASRLMVFTAEFAPWGREMWITDGTSSGTRVLAEIWPGPWGSDPDATATATDRVFLAARSPDAGREPFVVSFADLGAALAATLGEGCAGSNGVPVIAAIDRPLLGNAAFGVALRRARPTAPSILIAGFALLPGGDRNGCAAKVSAAAVAVTTTDGSGTAAIALPVPNDPNLLGLELYLHWASLDPLGGLVGALSLSPVLDVLIGR